MSLVLDVSVAAAFVLPDEASDYADAAVDRASASGGWVPDLFWHELSNVLLVAERRGRLEVGQADIELDGFRKLGLQTRFGPTGPSVFALARGCQLTAYDASYAALSAETGLPLATLDHRLAGSAEAGRFLVFDPEAPSVIG